VRLSLEDVLVYSSKHFVMVMYGTARYALRGQETITLVWIESDYDFSVRLSFSKNIYENNKSQVGYGAR